MILNRLTLLFKTEGGLNFKSLILKGQYCMYLLVIAF